MCQLQFNFSPFDRCISAQKTHPDKDLHSKSDHCYKTFADKESNRCFCKVLSELSITWSFNCNKQLVKCKVHQTFSVPLLVSRTLETVSWCFYSFLDVISWKTKTESSETVIYFFIACWQNEVKLVWFWTHLRLRPPPLAHWPRLCQDWKRPDHQRCFNMRKLWRYDAAKLMWY